MTTTSSTPSITVGFGPFRFDARDERLWRDDVEIALRPKAAGVLATLLRRPGEVVTKRELLETIWPEGFVGDAVLAVCINEIRSALGDESKQPRYIVTQHRRGYRFAAPVRPLRVGNDGLERLVVGRAAELDELGAMWNDAMAGRRQVVLVAAPGGVGKTTLVDAVASTLAGRSPLICARGQCVEQFGAGEAYLPMLDALAEVCRGEHGALARTVLTTAAPTWMLQLPALIDPADLEAVRALTAGSSAERMLREVADALERLAASVPVLLIFEDLHDADPSTIELISYLARRRAPARLMIVGTYRPAEAAARTPLLRQVEQDLLARGLSRHTELSPLSTDAVEEYVARRLAAHQQTADLVGELYRRTEGNALFVEAVVDQLVRVAAGDAAGDAQALDRLGIPEGVRAFVDRQIEMLDADDCRLLEVAAAVGREFSVDTVSAGLDDGSGDQIGDVEDRCRRLTRTTSLLDQVGVLRWPDGATSPRFRFAHALYQESLYARLEAQSRRATVHGGIGRRLRSRYRARVDEIASELAMHFERAHDVPAAVEHRHRAALIALGRSAHREALGHLASASELVATLDDGPERWRLELPLRSAEAVAWGEAEWFGSINAVTAKRESARLARSLGDSSALIVALGQLCNAASTAGRLDQAIEIAGEMQSVIDADRLDVVDRLYAQNLISQTHLFRGELDAAATSADRAMQLHATLDGRRSARRFDEDPGMMAYANGALIHALLGHAEAAARGADDGLGYARHVGAPATLIELLWHGAAAHQIGGDPRAVVQWTAEALELIERHALPMFGFSIRVLDGWAKVRLGSDDERILDDLVAVYEGWLSFAAPLLTQPHAASLVADALLTEGRAADGLRIALDALNSARSTGELWMESELIGISAECRMALGYDASHELRESERRAAEQGAEALRQRAAERIDRLLGGDSALHQH